jgi:hypothetical protein
VSGVSPRRKPRASRGRGGRRIRFSIGRAA